MSCRTVETNFVFLPLIWSAFSGMFARDDKWGWEAIVKRVTTFLWVNCTERFMNSGLVFAFCSFQICHQKMMTQGNQSFPIKLPNPFPFKAEAIKHKQNETNWIHVALNRQNKNPFQGQDSGAGWTRNNFVDWRPTINHFGAVNSEAKEGNISAMLSILLQIKFFIFSVFIAEGKRAENQICLRQTGTSTRSLSQ